MKEWWEGKFDKKPDPDYIIKDLTSTSRNAKRLVDQVDEAHYGMNVPQLVNTMQNLAEVMAKLLEREAEK